MQVEGGPTCLHVIAKLDQCLVGDDGISSTKEEPGFGDVASKTYQNGYKNYKLVQNSELLYKHKKKLCNLLLQ